MRGLLVVIALALWLGSLTGVLALEHSDVGQSSLTCPAPGPDDSNYLPRHWSWIPPGEVCEELTGDVGPTTYMRIPFGAALVVIPVVALVAWPHRPVNRRWDAAQVGKQTA